MPVKLVFGLCVLSCGIFSVGSIHAAILKDFIHEYKKSSLRWDSLQHDQAMSSSRLDALRREVLELLESDQDFEKAYQALSVEDQKFLSQDDPDDRTEPFDVLSIALKNEIQDLWIRSAEVEHGVRLAFEPGRLWSLAKTRLRRAMSQEGELDRINVLRVRGMASTQAFVICSHPELSWQTVGHEAFVSDSTQRRGMSTAFLDFSKLQSLSCGSETWAVELSSYSAERPDFVLPVKKDEESKAVFRVGAFIALQARTSESAVRAAKRLMRHALGLEFVEEQVLDLREAFESLFVGSDVFVPFSDIAHLNAFQWSRFNAQGILLLFHGRSRAGRPVELQIVLSPTERDSSGWGMGLTEGELAELFRLRREQTSLAPTIIELSCFSLDYISAWLSAFRRSLQDEQAEAPLVIASGSGHAAEENIEILSQMVLVLSAALRAADQPRAEAMIEALNRGPWWLRGLVASFSATRWLGHGLKPSADFQAVSSRDRFFRPWHGSLESVKQIQLSSSKEQMRLAPVVSID